MVKHLVKHGNSYALIIDKPVMDLLRITPETALDVTTDGRNLVLSPTAATAPAAAFTKALGRVNQRYRKAFKKLAE
ncbi:MAG: AbrB/MazE/SpoVT family DNA-binding domain-containing protein [Phycisphaerae bacterium]